MRTIKLRPWSFIQAVLADVVDNADDLQRGRSGFTAAAASKGKLPANGIFVGPVTLGHRIVDDRNLRRLAVIKLIEQPPTQKAHAYRVKIATGSGIDLRDGFLTGRTRWLAVHGKRN